MDKQARLRRIRDLLEHMLDCNNVLEWSEDDITARYLTKKLMGDLQVCQELCQLLDGESGVLVSYEDTFLGSLT